MAVIEDEVDLADAYCSLLGKLGWNASAFSGAEDLLAAMTSGDNHFAWLLIDYHLKDMDGLEAAKKVREIAPETRVVVMSGDQEIAEKASALGIKFLLKPFEFALLQETILDGGKVKKPTEVPRRSPARPMHIDGEAASGDHDDITARVLGFESPLT